MILLLSTVHIYSDRRESFMHKDTHSFYGSRHTAEMQGTFQTCTICFLPAMVSQIVPSADYCDFHHNGLEHQ